MVSKILSLLLAFSIAGSPAYAGSPAIFSGSNAKFLKSNLDLNGAVSILTGTVDPTSSATSAPAGSLYLNTTSGKTYRKTDAGSSTNWNEYATTSAVAPSAANEISNLGIKASINSSTLVVELKQSDGSTDCSAGSPCKIGTRGTSATTGSYTQSSITAAMSITLAAADSIGHPSSGSFPIWVYYIADATSEVCLSRSHFEDDTLQSASALTGGADTTSTTLWCTSAHTSKPIRKIGKILASWANPNWSAITNVTVNPKDNGCRHISGAPDECTESARVSCSGSSSITVNPGSWLSAAGNISTGVCALTIASGVFSVAPRCNPQNTTNSGTFIAKVPSAPTTTSVSVFMMNTTNGGADGSDTFDIVCTGAR